VTHDLWMAKAIEEARAWAQEGGAPIVALVVSGDTLLAVGRNTRAAEGCGFAHAELNALLAAKPLLGRHPQGVTLYATLEPCAMCLGALVFAGISRLVYGSSDPEGGAVEMFRQHPVYHGWLPEIISGVMAVECDKLLQMPTMFRAS
jgi:tRNA(adenine34) deaminase